MTLEDEVADIVFDALKEGGHDCIMSPAKSARAVANFRARIDQDPPRAGKWGFHVQERYNRPFTSLPARRIFLSEYDIKKSLEDGKTLRIPKSAIVSPLAQEWLDEKRVQIIRE